MALVALTATPVAAAECLLDTKNDGVADALDTDGGAASSDPTALACGFAEVCLREAVDWLADHPPKKAADALYYRDRLDVIRERHGAA